MNKKRVERFIVGGIIGFLLCLSLELGVAVWMQY